MPSLLFTSQSQSSCSGQRLVLGGAAASDMCPGFVRKLVRHRHGWTERVVAPSRCSSRTSVSRFRQLCGDRLYAPREPFFTFPLVQEQLNQNRWFWIAWPLSLLFFQQFMEVTNQESWHSQLKYSSMLKLSRLSSPLTTEQSFK